MECHFLSQPLASVGNCVWTMWPVELDCWGRGSRPSNWGPFTHGSSQSCLWTCPSANILQPQTTTLGTFWMVPVGRGSEYGHRRSPSCIFQAMEALPLGSALPPCCEMPFPGHILKVFPLVCLSLRILLFQSAPQAWCWKVAWWPKPRKLSNRGDRRYVF